MSDELPKPPEKTRVLVIEDVPRLRGLLVSAIPGMGFPASGAASAEDAIHIMEHDPHDVIVLDLNLPGMEGLEFLQILHDRWPGTSVIILTAFGDLEAAQRAIRLDVVDFLTKPASLGDLEIALDRAHRRRRQFIAPHPESIASESAPDNHARTEPPHSLQELQREHILAVLAHNNGNRAATASELGISLRTLYYRLAEYQGQRAWPR